MSTSHKSIRRRLAPPLTVAAVCLTALVLAAGCSAPAKRKLLTFFFDGVPAENSGKRPAVAATNTAPVADTPVVAAVQSEVPKGPQIFSHPPYQQQKCSECHQSNAAQQLRVKTPDLCFQCHKDFLTAKKVKHQPAETGDCMSCHSPHESENKKLLVHAADKLCMDCHDSPTAKGPVKHQPAENGECLSCHNPHASDSKGLLVKSADKLCFDCHDDLEKKIKTAKFKHDPAGNGECASCHSPHESAEKALLTKARGQLCFDCHEEKDLKGQKAHDNVAGKTCVDCHDPHAGDNKSLVKAGVTVTAKAN